MIHQKLQKQKYIGWAEHDSKTYPWRRCFARVLDMNVSFFFIKLLVKILFGINFFFTDFLFDGFGIFTVRTIMLFLSIFIFSFLAHIFINAFLISYSGMSIGKYFFGVSVYNADGILLDFNKACKREWMVFYRGEALWIPIISTIAWVVAYFNLTKNGTTSWDRDLQTKLLYRDVSAQHYLFVLIGVLLIFYI